MNSRFNATCAKSRPIDRDAFLGHLASVVAPIVDHVAAAFAEKIDPVVAALFDISLELFTARLLGPEARHPLVADAWRKVLPVAPMLLAREPKRLAASLSNATANLAVAEGARASWWIERMSLLATKCQSVTELLDCGTIIAWLAGMPRCRTAEIATLERLPSPLGLLVLEAPFDWNEQQLEKLVDQLQADRWLTIERAVHRPNEPRQLQIVQRVGAFRGFGGTFIRPPRMSPDGSLLRALDGDGVFEIHADAYGAAVTRAPGSSVDMTSDNSIRISPLGELRWNGQQATFSELSDVSSSCQTANAIAVTLRTSHHIYLLANSGK